MGCKSGQRSLSPDGGWGVGFGPLNLLRPVPGTYWALPTGLGVRLDRTKKKEKL